MSRSKLEFIASFTRMMRFSSLRIYKTCLRLTNKVFLHLLRNITKNYFITTREPIKYKYMLLMVLFSESCYLNRYVCMYIYIYIYMLNIYIPFLFSQKNTLFDKKTKDIYLIYIFNVATFFKTGFYIHTCGFLITKVYIYFIYIFKLRF